MTKYGKKIARLFNILLTLITQNVLSSAKGSVLHKYLIATEGCKIPAFPTISKDIKILISPAKEFNCSENIHLLNSNASHIWIVEDYLDLYNVFNKNDFYCCYSNFYAEKNIAKIKYGNCIEFTKDIQAENEFVKVECFYLDDRIYVDFFLFPLFTTTKDPTNSEPDFNVLMFGIESMSRMNFIRMMPRTHKFLRDKGSIQLLGYNKIGDNSFPNLFPLLFGESYKQVKRSCIQKNIIDVTKCVIMWDLFKAAGYHTALASDSIAGLLGTYEYSLPVLPTDYYLQPFIFETRNIFKNMFYNFHQCLRNRYFYKLLLNWSANLLKTSNKKLFGLFWEESVSHENFNLPQNMDEYHYDFFLELENSKHLEDSIVILFSDHGMRFGEIAQTEQGRVENRLPLFEILFPKLFQDRYPLAFKNFQDNRHRLTTPFDIYETLLDIIALKNLDNTKIKERSKKITRSTKKISLFLPVPKQRSCESIGIEEHWCTCQKTKGILDLEHKELAVNYLINYINLILKKYPQCHQLKVLKILKATFIKESKSNIVTFGIAVQTLPGGGIFDATLHGTGQELSISGTVSRLNLYRYTSQCVQNDEVKMYCTCKSL